ncbi:MAG: FtsX-like permease family protein, partial [Bdellovibrionales bacterium]|nr:FtsX-like permease family protein [Bdellovibrionales bacterium]
MVFTYAIRELKRHARYSLLFVLNITLGLFGLCLLESFKTAIQDQIRNTSQIQAGGDLIVSSQMPIPKDLILKISTVLNDMGTSFETGEVEELFTMVSSGDISRLVQIRSQDLTLPFYGEIKLNPGNFKKRAFENENTVWVYPELLLQLKAKVGDKIKVAGTPFVITNIVENDSASVFGRGSLAPRIYMSRSNVHKLGLIQKGSRVSYKKIYKLSEKDRVQHFVSELQSQIKDPSIRIRSHVDESESNARALTYLGDYLGLVALVALLLSSIGTIYLFRAHLLSRLKEYAVLKMLGCSSRKISNIIVVQIAALAILGALLSILFSFLLFPLISSWVRRLIPFDINLILEPTTIVLLFLVGLGGTLLSVFPLVFKLRAISPNVLFQESTSRTLSFTLKDVLLWIPFVGFFYALAVWQCHSVINAFAFCVLLLCSAIVLALLCHMGLRLLEKCLPKSNFKLRYALLELTRKPLETTTVFVALGLGGMLPMLISTLESTLNIEFSFESNQNRASLFLFDIQEEQVESLDKHMKTLNSPLVTISPLIRARLQTVNGKPYERADTDGLQTRESERNARSGNRTFNLTERQKLSESETVSKGRYFLNRFDPKKQALAEISLEEQFAKRMDLHIGDHLGFDVLGATQEGEVVGLRRVKWVTFQPNFFIQFQEGVFDGAPKTYLASMGAMSMDQMIDIQNHIVQYFPNVSIVDVGRVVDQILEVSNQMSTGLEIMALLVLLCSVVVFFSIQAFHVQRARVERKTLRLLGCNTKSISVIESHHRWILLTSALCVGFVACFLVAMPL